MPHGTSPKAPCCPRSCLHHTQNLKSCRLLGSLPYIHATGQTAHHYSSSLSSQTLAFSMPTPSPPLLLLLFVPFPVLSIA
ncbi:hypothetical protein CsSME_00034438 [Camellia sinensis var. sinensis]